MIRCKKCKKGVALPGCEGLCEDCWLVKDNIRFHKKLDKKLKMLKKNRKVMC